MFGIYAHGPRKFWTRTSTTKDDDIESYDTDFRPREIAAWDSSGLRFVVMIHGTKVCRLLGFHISRGVRCFPTASTHDDRQVSEDDIVVDWPNTGKGPRYSDNTDRVNGLETGQGY